MPLFHIDFVFGKICNWPITLKLLEILLWKLEYIFTIKIYIIINMTHNSTRNTY
jgi:hypothetical protein